MKKGPLKTTLVLGGLALIVILLCILETGVGLWLWDKILGITAM
jgi:uncharacterized membrane protein SirB2